MAYVITELCIRDGACMEVCPVECITAGPEGDAKCGKQYYINPDDCIECGACAPECPQDAIFPEDEVPEQYRTAIALNRAFYEEGPGYSAR